MELILPIIIFAGMLWIYILPSHIAFYKNHEKKWEIAGVNILLGWTLIFWGGCLIWACFTENKKQSFIFVQNQNGTYDKREVH